MSADHSSNKPIVIRLDEPEWDLLNAHRLGSLLQPAYSCERVVIDMTGVRFMDSVAVAQLLVMCRERVLRHGYPPAHLAISSLAVFRMLDIMGLRALWSTHATVAAAVRAAAKNDCTEAS